MSHDNCKLCNLVQDRDIHSQYYYEGAYFIMVDCETCGVPLLASQKHIRSIESYFTDYKMIAEHLFKTYANRENFDKWYVDFKMKTCRDHWHAHLRRK